jgi:hypothetical protein
MRFNRRMNGLETAFEGAPAISLCTFQSQFLQIVVRPSAFSSQPVKTPSAGGR